VAYLLETRRTVGGVRLLRSRQFFLLFVGEAINGIGSWAALIALWGYAAYKFDSGPTEIAWLGLAWSAPAALVGPLVGVPIDRIGPRKVLVWTYAAASIIAVAMAFTSTYGQLLALSVVYGVTHAFGHPAGAALPPRLVDDADLLPANALLGAAQESSMIFGPLLAAAVIALWGVRAAFVADALTYWVGIAVLLPLRLREVVPEVRTRLRTEIAEGVRIARGQPVVRFTLAISAAVFLCWSTFIVVEPIYVRETLHRSATLLGLFQTAFGVGMVGTGLLLPRLGDRVATPRALAVSVVLSGFTAVAYVGTRWIAVAFVGVFLWGVDVAFFSAPSRTLLQRATPASAHGRVLSLFNTVESWVAMLAIPLAGVVASAVGVQGLAFIVAAVATTAGVIGLFTAPQTRLEEMALQNEVPFPRESDVLPV
jgi:predicted MFS family arabinose efflux permease